MSRQRGRLCQFSIRCLSNLKFIFHDLTCRNGVLYFLLSAGTMFNSGGLQRDIATKAWSGVFLLAGTCSVGCFS